MAAPSRGIVYVATRREHYVAEAFLSAHSAKDFAPDLPITIFTDLHTSPFATSPCFDQVVPLATTRRYRSGWAEGQLDRVRSLINSPYDHTLHLDSDTRVMTPDFLALFPRLADIDIGMAVCEPDVSKCASWTGLPMFNVGLILYRRSAQVLALLAAWEDLTRRHFELGNLDQVPQIDGVPHIDDAERRRDLLFMDQTSFVQLLSPEVNRFDLKREILDEGWNFRGTGAGRTLAHPLRISHHPSLRGRLGEDIVARARQYQQAGQAERARALLQCLHDELVPPENHAAREMVRGLIAGTSAG